MQFITIIIFFTIMVVCIVMAIINMRQVQTNVKIGGATHKTHSPHIVIDMLNLTHWMNGSSTIISPEIIAKTIDDTASTILAKYNGRVMYVVKDRDSQFNDDAAREIYKKAAERNGVYVYVVERYQDPANTPMRQNNHSSSGRDDLFMTILAQRWKCTILTEDRLNDFNQFRTSIYPFHVYEFAFWRAIPYREFINPMIVKNKLKKPKTTRLGVFFLKK